MKKQTVKRISRSTKHLFVSVIVLVAVIAIFFSVQWWLGYKIREEIEGLEFTHNGSTVHLNVKQVEVGLWGRSAKISGLSLTGTLGGKPSFSLNVASGSINIKGLNLKMFDSDTVIIPAVDLHGPDIYIDTYDVAPTDTVRKGNASWKPLGIALLAVKECNITINSHEGEYTSTSTVSALDLTIENPSPPLIRGNILSALAHCSLSLDGITMSNGDSTSVTKFGRISYDSKEAVLSTEFISITPLLEPTEFAGRNYRHSDWTSLSTGSVTAYGIDTAAMSAGRLAIDSLTITGADFQSLKNRNVDAVPGVKKMFHEKLQSIPFLLSVDLVRIGPMNVVYREIARGESEAGSVEFESLTGEFHNLTNGGTAENPLFTLEARGKLYGRADIAAKFYIPAGPAVNRFEITGHIADMPLSMINRVITPLENVEIKFGHLDRMDFHITGSGSHSSARGTLLYHGLRIAMLKHNSRGTKERRFVTWIANKALLSDNPHNGITKHAEGQAERDFHRSQFNYLWHSLLALVEDTIKTRD